MDSPDGQDKLAPVTFLFAPRGEKAEQDAVSEPSGETPPRESTVRFVDLYPESETDEGTGSRADEPQGRYEPHESHDVSVRDARDARAEKRAERAAQRANRGDGEFEPINNVSLHALGRRGISAAEMNDLLLKRGFDADAVMAECDRLLGVGLLDDALLAEALVRSLRERKGLGRGAVSAELKRRKIDPLVIEQTLSELDGEDDAGRALELAIKRAPQLRNLDHATAQRRLSGFLMRKGYSSSAVSSAVSTALAGGSSRSGGPVFR